MIKWLRKRKALKNTETGNMDLYDIKGNPLGNVKYYKVDLTSYGLEKVSKKKLDKWAKIYEREKVKPK